MFPYTAAGHKISRINRGGNEENAEHLHAVLLVFQAAIELIDRLAIFSWKCNGWKTIRVFFFLKGHQNSLDRRVQLEI